MSRGLARGNLRLRGRVALVALAGCSPSVPAGSDGAAVPPDVAPASCTTRISYGSAWIAPDSHATRYDDVPGVVTWDATCTDDDAGNSGARLSNGFQPSFTGPSGCVIALDASPGCGGATACTTRVAYGSGWIPPAHHPDAFDDISGRVFGDGICPGGGDPFAELSNGAAPHFSGGTCPLSFAYAQCGGLYTNPVIPVDCPDPGVLRDGDHYVLSCTSGDAPAAYPIYTSPDLARWTFVGDIFAAGHTPTWATGDFWAPEIHRVGPRYVAYFSARATTGQLAIGAATAASATGPFTDLGHPLITQAGMGLIDASEFTAADGTPYVLWKEDGNALGRPTPIHAQRLTADGLALAGTAATLVTNDQPWEGAVTEGPWLVEHGGLFYLFYSGNSYADARYAVGVARGPAPDAPMTKLPDPILVTGGAWVGPGHCSVLATPAGEAAIVYHAWRAGCVNHDGCGRDVLVDALAWGSDGWPRVPLGPSATTRPEL